MVTEEVLLSLLQRAMFRNELLKSNNNQFKENNFVKVHSSSLLRAIIACNHLLLLEIFSNFVHFCPNFQIFCPFSTFLCPFSEKSHPCTYFLEKALLIIEAARTEVKRAKTITKSNHSIRPQVVVNRFPENQDVFNGSKLVPGELSYTDAVKSTLISGKQNRIINDSKFRGICQGLF